MSDRDRLRIALFTYSTQPRGGVLHALALAEALGDLGHDTVLFALADGEYEFVRTPRCPYVLVRVDPERDDLVPFVRRRIAAYVDAWDPESPAFDVYHAHDGISGNALATLVERGRIPNFVRTVHHLDDFGASDLTALQERSVVRAAHCLVVSERWRERLEADYGIAAAVVPNGVDTTRFRPLPAAERAALRARLGYGDGPLFVTIGGIESRKNTLAALDAFALVRARIPSARLAIAGGASIFTHSAYRAAFHARARKLGLDDGDALQIAGVLSDAQIVALLQAANAFVFPSVVEGFGLVVLEALACATPVVTSAVAPFTEFLGAGDALLVDPHDARAIAAAMLRVLDPAVAASVFERGPALARRFTWEACARAHVRAYFGFRPLLPLAARA